MIGGKLIQYQYDLKWYTFIVSFTKELMMMWKQRLTDYGVRQRFV